MPLARPEPHEHRYENWRVLGRALGFGNLAVDGERHTSAQQSLQDEFVRGAFQNEALLGPPLYQIKS